MRGAQQGERERERAYLHSYVKIIFQLPNKEIKSNQFSLISTSGFTKPFLIYFLVHFICTRININSVSANFRLKKLNLNLSKTEGRY